MTDPAPVQPDATPDQDSCHDPIAAAIYAREGAPVLERFAALRPDATEQEVGGARALVIMINIYFTLLARLSTRLDTAVLVPGTPGIFPTDYLFTPTALDTAEERERVAALLTAPFVRVEPEAAPPTTSCRYTGFYL